MQPSKRSRQTNKERCDAFSIPVYVIRKKPEPWCSPWRVREALHVFCSRRMICCAKPQRKITCISSTGGTEMKHTENSLTAIGWTRDDIENYDEIASLPKQYIATRNERDNNKNSWELKINCEGEVRPAAHSLGYNEAKKKCQKMYEEYSAATGTGNKHIPPEQRRRQRQSRQYQGLEEFDCCVDLQKKTGWRYYPTSSTSSSSSSSQ